jgi:hypothetical protein
MPMHAAAAAARSMPYKNGAPKFRWMGPQGHSFLIGVVHIGIIQYDGDYGDMMVVHTDQVSLRRLCQRCS